MVLNSFRRRLLHHILLKFRSREKGGSMPSSAALARRECWYSEQKKVRERWQKEVEGIFLEVSRDDDGGILLGIF
jgi:hypothetical protein